MARDPEENDNKSIDAIRAIEIENEKRQDKNEVRGRSTIDEKNRHFILNFKKLIIPLVIIFSTILISVFYLQHRSQPKLKAGSSNNIVRNTLPPYKRKTVKLKEVELNKVKVSDPIIDQTVSNTNPAEQPVKESPTEVLRKRRLNAALHSGGKESTQSKPSANSSEIHASSDSDPIHLSGQQANQNGSSATQNSLSNQLQPLQLKPAFAGHLGDRNYLLTQGAVLDCVLETRLITTQPGLCLCTLTRDVYSANGRVILLDRGSKIVGHYQGNLNQGQVRIFVLWTRIETPKGVIINLDSPGAGPLGEGGLGGYIDTHFWERFGGAIMLSLIDDLSDFASHQGKESKNSQINFNTTSNAAQDMAGEALKNSINIPPTLYKNQGDRITVFVARDLDFRGVYDLQLQQ